MFRIKNTAHSIGRWVPMTCLLWLLLGCDSGSNSGRTGGEGTSSSSSSSSSSTSSGSSGAGLGFAPLNDSGRTSCSSDTDPDTSCGLALFPGQDAEFGRDRAAVDGSLVKIGGGQAGFDFSKLGEDGMPLLIQDGEWEATGTEAQGSHWSCVKDNTTQLTWEIKHTNPAHARYGMHSYSWYNTDDSRNGGIAGVADAGECTHARCDTAGYVEYINSIELCGYSDWRMPSVSEFYSLGHQGRVDPAIDDHYFPNTLGGLRYWTADSSAGIPQLGWYMYFSDGSISYTHKGNASHVRLVRTDQPRLGESE